MPVLSTPHDEIIYVHYTFKFDACIFSCLDFLDSFILFFGVQKSYLFKIKAFCNSFSFKCILFTPK